MKDNKLEHGALNATNSSACSLWLVSAQNQGLGLDFTGDYRQKA
jgi:hypothetical protein